ncbi:MAG: stage 0 sporulation family protein [Oscillospiraceae bacterium]|nr:stage 0 sporulation family protein [Oscillospiraceae bacterium]
MARIIGVKLNQKGKIYYCDSTEKNLQNGENVVVETSRGLEFGKIIVENMKVRNKKIGNSIKRIVRIATEKDLKRVQENQIKAKNAMDIFNKKIKEHSLRMKLIDAEYTLDARRVIFCFTAESRVDFRNLVKDLAAVLRTRIELRQIGIRDETKKLGGFGICGKLFCCTTFLNEFHSVSIRMAKEQGISLSPSKISGACGRLMCCLKYEEQVYLDLLKAMPSVGEIVDTPEGRGTVIDLIPLTQMVKVQVANKQNELVEMNFHVDSVDRLNSKTTEIQEELNDLEKE